MFSADHPERSASDDVAQHYHARGAAHEKARLDASAEARRVAQFRLVVAAVLIVALLLLLRRDQRLDTLLGILVPALLIAFAALVMWHGRIRQRESTRATLARVAARGALRVHRAWKSLEEPRWSGSDAPSQVSLDLAVEGAASLSQLLDVVLPVLGGRRLRAWLLDPPAPKDVIVERQRAARELSQREELLEGHAADALGARGMRGEPLNELAGWGVGPARPEGVATRVARLVLPAITLAVGLQILAGAGTMTADEVRPWGEGLALLVIISLLLAARAQRALVGTYGRVGQLPALLAPAVAMMHRFASERFESTLLQSAQGKMNGGVHALAELERLLRWGEIRYSPMAHWALNALVMLDVQLDAALERWRARQGGSAPGWLDALADLEALSAMATLARDNPSWVYPSVQDSDEASASALEAQALGHPLIAPAVCVTNDVHLSGAGSALVVSGSNMAGKSTLLRAIGLNTLLANAGGPACARAMRVWRVSVWSSIRVHDALEEGVSLYLAELRRLRAIVDAARARPGHVPVLYLLDEVLHGTNSADRRTATQAVLRHLSAAGAVGVITTHDLELTASLDGVATTHVHFRESITPSEKGPQMTFDYHARPGVATSRNALALLEAMGLGSG